MTDDQGDDGLFVELTDREWHVVRAVSAGRSNKATARELAVSVKTVEFHLGNVYRKLGVASRGELTHLVHERTWASAYGERSASAIELNPHIRNLPLRAAQRVVGRVDDMALLRAACEQHLVTVVGVGGVGKTTLAVAVAGTLTDRFRDGVWFVDLTVVRQDVEVAGQVADALHLPMRVGRSVAESVARGIGAEARLILVDNCEHVVEGAVDVIGHLVARCPNVTVLATSRERLDLPAEHVVPLGPLPLAGAAGAAGSSPAAQLFCERARQVLGRFEPGPTERADIDIMCVAVDGLPLAIELAASRLSSLSISDLVANVGERLALLHRGRDRGGRHDSLRATIAWSFKLLTESEQRLFESLAIFPGDFDLAAADAVGQPNGDALDLVTSLVERSLLVAFATAGGTRYRLLQTVRAYASERLARRGGLDAVRHAHLAHYEQFMAQADAGFRGPNEPAAERAFRSEWHNCRAAFETADELGSPDDACMLVRHAFVWGCGRGVHDVGVWAERVSHRALSPALRVVATSARMVFATSGGDRQAARTLSAQALAEDAALGGTGEPWAHWAATWPTFTWTDAIAAAVALETRAARTGDAFWIAMAATSHAEMLAHSFETYGSEDSRALADFTVRATHALELAEALGRPASIGKAMHCLGIALAHSSEPERGRDLLTRSIELGERSCNWPLVLGGHVELIRLDVSLDAFDAVFGHIAAIVSVAERVGVGAGDRRHLMRFAAEAIGATRIDDAHPAGVAALRERIIQAIGPEESARRIATGQVEGTAAAVNRFHYLTPW